MRKRLGVFGSTGTIGGNTLELARRFPERFEVVALTAGRNLEKLKTQIAEFRPKVVVVQNAVDAAQIAHTFSGLEVLWGETGLVQCANWSGMDIACQGIVGFAALAPTLELVRTGKKVALANKETLVVAGHLLKAEQERSGALCIPVDSEHNAIYQLLMGKDPASIDSLVLTASGGPFWQQRDLDFDAVSPESAVRHPNWKMGPKISVDSATLMNKGMEVVEAHSLFGMPADRIEVWIHPQSIVHGAVWFEDGTCQAQMSKPDMKASIGFALGFPDRLPRSVDKLSIKQFAQLDFAEPDTTRFPCLDLPRLALAAGQSHLVALNAANEVTVEAFLAKKIRFSQIPQVLRQVLDSHRSREVDALEGVFTTDALARQKTQEILQSLCV